MPLDVPELPPLAAVELSPAFAPLEAEVVPVDVVPVDVVPAVDLPAVADDVPVVPVEPPPVPVDDEALPDVPADVP